MEQDNKSKLDNGVKDESEQTNKESSELAPPKLDFENMAPEELEQTIKELELREQVLRNLMENLKQNKDDGKKNKGMEEAGRQLANAESELREKALLALMKMRAIKLTPLPPSKPSSVIIKSPSASTLPRTSAKLSSVITKPNKPPAAPKLSSVITKPTLSSVISKPNSPTTSPPSPSLPTLSSVVVNPNSPTSTQPTKAELELRQKALQMMLLQRAKAGKTDGAKTDQSTKVDQPTNDQSTMHSTQGDGNRAEKEAGKSQGYGGEDDINVYLQIFRIVIQEKLISKVAAIQLKSVCALLSPSVLFLFLPPPPR